MQLIKLDIYSLMLEQNYDCKKNPNQLLTLTDSVGVK